MSAAAGVAAVAGKSKRIAGGAFLICCPSRGHDDRTPSCKVFDGPDERAMFHCFAGCDWRDVRAGAEALGLIPASPSGRLPIAARQREKIERARREREAHENRRRARKQEWARRIWAASTPMEGTLAARYLASRGMRSPYSSSLRFISGQKHPVCEHVGPVLVSAFTLGHVSPVAIHLTFIKSDGAGKADIEPAKVIIGSPNGGTVRLSEPRGALCVAEGLENGLSVQQAAGIPTWAAMNASLMGNVILPPIERGPNLYIASDPDPAGQRAADKLALRAKREGWAVHRVPAPDGCDWNSILLEAAQ